MGGSAVGLTVGPLCIIQARYNSTRLPGKMLLPLAGETLIERAWNIAAAAFGDCVVAIPANDNDGPLGAELRRIRANVYPWVGPEADVLRRFFDCAHHYRWHPDSVIVRYTPDDPYKDIACLRAVAAGERLPVELGGEAFTLAMLDAAQADARSERYGPNATYEPSAREHITRAIFPTPPPPAPDGVWTIDTQEDYDAVVARLA